MVNKRVTEAQEIIMNIQRYSYIRDEQDGVCFCRIAERGNGEYIKSKDVSELSSLLYAWRDKYLSDLSLNACNELNRLIEQIAPPNLTSECNPTAPPEFRALDTVYGRACAKCIHCRVVSRWDTEPCNSCKATFTNFVPLKP